MEARNGRHDAGKPRELPAVKARSLARPRNNDNGEIVNSSAALN